MRVVLHCVYFPPEVGGLESHVFHLARGLVRRGHDVHMVTSRSRSDLPATEDMDGVRVVRTPLRARTPSGWIGHAVRSTPTTVRLARGAEIVHAQAFGSILPCGLARRRTGAPMVATFHTSHFLMRAERPGWRLILRQLVRAPDYCLAASEEIAEVAGRLAPGVHVEALTNGVDTEMFRPVAPAVPEGRASRVIVPRRLFEKNGVEYLVRAVPRLRELRAGAPLEVMVVGDGPEGTRLRALADQLGVGETVRFLGARPNDEMPGLFASSALAVLPSLMEATSIAALEAMACAVPVAASNVGGLPEIVDDGVGGLFPPADPQGLAETVAGLLARPDLARLGEAARVRVVQNWSVDRLVDRHLEIYQSVIDNRKRGAGDRGGS